MNTQSQKLWKTGVGWVLAAMALGWAGCATTKLPPHDPHLLDFLRDGQTKRNEIVLRLGQPSRAMEGERVLFYRLGQSPKGYFLRESQHNWEGVRYSLVLVLDERGVLHKHALVNVR